MELWTEDGRTSWSYPSSQKESSKSEGLCWKLDWKGVGFGTPKQKGTMKGSRLAWRGTHPLCTHNLLPAPSPNPKTLTISAGFYMLVQSTQDKVTSFSTQSLIAEAFSHIFRYKLGFFQQLIIVSIILKDLGLTRRRPHPEGKKARAAANISVMVRPQTTNNTVITDMNPRKRSALRILNISWKSVPNLRLPIDTICNQYRYV